MAISPIGGITTYSPVASVQPMNYAIENGSEVSDVYAAETTKSSAVVNGTSPVQYPSYNARANAASYQMIGSKFDAYA